MGPFFLPDRRHAAHVGGQRTAHGLFEEVQAWREEHCQA